MFYTARIGAARFRTPFVFCGLAVAMAASCFLLYSAVTERLTDLAVYRMGGRAVVYGRPLYAQLDGHTGLPFTYTPFSGLIFGPVAVVPTPLAQVAWTLLLLGFLYTFVRMSFQYALPERARRLSTLETIALVGVALAAEPIRHNLDLGQINLVLSVMVTSDLTERDRWLPRGIWTGIAAGIKLTPLIFILYYALAGRRRSSAVALASFFSTVAVGGAVAPQSSWKYWTRLAFDPDHVGGVPYVGNQSLYGVMSRLMHGADNTGVLYMLLNSSILIVGLTGAAVAVRRASPFVGDMLCATTVLLVSPISWSHHWLWILPILLWLGLADCRPKGGVTGGLLGLSLFVAAPIWWVPRTHNVEYRHHGWQILAANSYFIAGISIFLALLWAAVGRRGSEEPAPGRTGSTIDVPAAPTQMSGDSVAERRQVVAPAAPA